MRLSSVFDLKLPVRFAQEPGHAASLPAGGAAEAARPVMPQELPDDLDQRVRQSGEWQLEDW